jgi:tRNA nucleotidyltransferase/poly(A) polymerase
LESDIVLNIGSQVIPYKFGVDAFPVKLYERAVSIVHKLKENGFYAYFVGGAIRDVLMGKKPEEIDIATNALPKDITKIFDKVSLVGAKFGVVKVHIDDDSFEVTTFRTDIDYKDGRHPEKISYTDPEQDSKRRDFTINAIFWEPIESKLYDYVGGLLDINNSVIKTVGDPVKRFNEDKLRILRCARFISQLSFNVDINIVNALSNLKDPFKSISMERVRDEFNKALLTKHPSYMFIFLQQFNFLKLLLPEISEMIGVPQPKEYHPEGDVWTHTLLGLELAANSFENIDLELMWAILLHDVGKPKVVFIPKPGTEDRIRFNKHDVESEKMAVDILTRFKMSNKFIKNVSFLVKNHMRIGSAFKMKKSKLKILMSDPNFENLMKLVYADVMSSHTDLKIYDFLKQEYENFKNEKKLPKAIVDGNFLINMGFLPSPQFSKIIEKSYEDQLDGVFKDEKEAKKYIKKKFS